MMSFGRRGVPLLCAAALLLGLLGAPPANAKLDAKAWKAAKAEFEKLFAERGDGAAGGGRPIGDGDVPGHRHLVGGQAQLG